MVQYKDSVLTIINKITENNMERDDVKTRNKKQCPTTDATRKR